MVFHLTADMVGAILLEQTEALTAGTVAHHSGTRLSIPCGDALLGRVVDPLGKALDGEANPQCEVRNDLDGASPPIVARDFVNRPLLTGNKVIDTLIPIGKGQRQLLIGDNGLGKSSLAIDVVVNQRNQDVLCVYVLVGQKRSSVLNTIQMLKDSRALEHTVLVVAEATALPGLQYLAPFAGCAVAEYWMRKGRDTLVVYDELTAHAMSYRELSLLLRRPPGREAYPADIFYLHSRLLERSTCLASKHGGGSMTALPIIETKEGEIASYIPTNLISITDGQVYFDSALFSSGFLPAIDVTRSSLAGRRKGSIPTDQRGSRKNEARLPAVPGVGGSHQVRRQARELYPEENRAWPNPARGSQAGSSEPGTHRMANGVACGLQRWASRQIQAGSDPSGAHQSVQMGLSFRTDAIHGTRSLEDIAGSVAKSRQPSMSKLSDLQSRMRALQDIEEILNAMKNLSLVEITKISRFYVTQQELLHSVECALADFQQFYGAPSIAEGPAEDSLYVLIGSERGFCGGFNETILRKLESETSTERPARLILVGRKLALRCLEDKRTIASLQGPNAAEEIPLVISQLAKVLTRFPGAIWKVIHNRYSNEGTSVEITCPFEFSSEKAHTAFDFPPLLNLTPSELRPATVRTVSLCSVLWDLLFVIHG